MATCGRDSRVWILNWIAVPPRHPPLLDSAPVDAEDFGLGWCGLDPRLARRMWHRNLWCYILRFSPFGAYGTPAMATPLAARGLSNEAGSACHAVECAASSARE